ncbi:hypothetical protein [Actinopolyspora mortivallis]|uniref:hypothetical protein n=1 Tax=Actinopolyspora mortivallis TaxID=33906 RepID=UPI0011B25490|nr:hypothetical protein [Actinopolyspora mortivallis]
MAVELSMESGSVLTLYWDMDGVNEGIASDFRTSEEKRFIFPGHPVDVTSRADWNKFIGVPVSDINLAWHVPNERCAQMPWSYHFVFSDDVSLVVALGEDEGSGLAYMPDALVVILDKEIAIKYKIPASKTSSCGYP